MGAAHLGFALRSLNSSTATPISNRTIGLLGLCECSSIRRGGEGDTNENSLSSYPIDPPGATTETSWLRTCQEELAYRSRTYMKRQVPRHVSKIYTVKIAQDHRGEKAATDVCSSGFATSVLDDSDRVRLLSRSLRRMPVDLVMMAQPMILRRDQQRVARITEGEHHVGRGRLEGKVGRQVRGRN